MRADWVQVLEAAYAVAEDDHVWGQRLMDAAESLFGERAAMGMSVMEHSPDCSSSKMLLTLGPPSGEIANHGTIVGVGAAGIRALYYPESIVTTMRDILKTMQRTTREVMSAYQKRHDMTDGIGLVVHPEPGIAVVLYSAYERTVQLSGHHRRLLTQIALHLETSYRLRRRPEIVRAVVTAEGKIVHRETGAPDAVALQEHVKRVERARTRRNRSTPEAIDLWEALVGGRASIAERTEGSRRHYLVIDNAPSTQPLRAMTPGEIDVVSFATRGLSAKLVGYALGISPSRVSSRLQSAAMKVGLATRIELVRLAAMLTRDPRARFADFALTTAERDVLALLAHGFSDREIAAIRNRSVRTIANQVARLLRKTSSATRRALVTRAR
jgi:DNA-binding NarL/FixJ family response regulator